MILDRFRRLRSRGDFIPRSETIMRRDVQEAVPSAWQDEPARLTIMLERRARRGRNG